MFCWNCGKEYEGNFCPNCGAPMHNPNQNQTMNYPVTSNIQQVSNNWKNGTSLPQQKKGRPASHFILIAIGIFFVLGTLYSIIDRPEEKNNSRYSKSETITETKQEYIASCKEYDYKELLRNPNNYMDKRVYFTGTVLDISESRNEVTFRIDLYPNKIGTDGFIYVTYFRKDKNESHVLNDDIVTIYGEFKGTEQAYNLLLNEITMPKVTAKYIELQTE